MRLIDADVLIKKLESNSWDIDEWELPNEQISAGLTANAMDMDTVEGMPTVDAVEVIRCKDCKHCDTVTIFGKTTLYSCTRKNPAVDVLPNDYCSRGRRIDES